MKSKLLWLRGRYPRAARALAFAWLLTRSLLKHNALEFASALAYTAFFSLVPLLALLGFVLGALVRRTGTEAVLGPFIERAPETSRALINAALDQLAGSSSGVAPLAVLGFLWIASSGAHGSMDILEIMLSAKPRPWWRKRAIALAWILGFLAVMGASTTVMFKATTRVEEDAILVNQTTNAERELPPEQAASLAAEAAAKPSKAGKMRAPQQKAHERLVLRRKLVWLGGGVVRLLTLLWFLGLGFFGLAWFYRVGVRYEPAEEPAGDRRRIYPGALVALVGFFVVSSAFGLYVAKFGRYVTYYGGLATMAVLLLWLYLTAFAFLIGAEVNVLLEGRRDLTRRGADSKNPPPTSDPVPLSVPGPHSTPAPLSSRSR